MMCVTTAPRWETLFFPLTTTTIQAKKRQILFGMKVQFQGYMLVYLSFFPVLGTFHFLVQQPFRPENFSVSGKPFYAVRGDELIISSEATWQCSGSPRRCHVKTALLRQRQKPNVSLFFKKISWILSLSFFIFGECCGYGALFSVKTGWVFRKGHLVWGFYGPPPAPQKASWRGWQDGRMRDESWKYSSNTTLSWLSWSKIRLGPCHCRIWNLWSLPYVQIPRLHCL